MMICASGLHKAEYGFKDGSLTLSFPRTAPCSPLALINWPRCCSKDSVASHHDLALTSSPKPEPLIAKKEPGPHMKWGRESVSINLLPASAGASAKCQWGAAIDCRTTCQHNSWWPAIRVIHQAWEFQESLSTHSKWELLQNQVLRSNCMNQFEMLICSLRLHFACEALEERLPAKLIEESKYWFPHLFIPLRLFSSLWAIEAQRNVARNDFEGIGSAKAQQQSTCASLDLSKVSPHCLQASLTCF